VDAATHTACANTLKGLAIDAVQAANSGHPGLPLGAADVATVLWTRFLKHDPSDPDWADRDRFVLSAGHGSMLLYGLLHLSGYDLSLDEIRRFRQLHSKTPGHPEHGHTAGVETTTGPLGQGLANAVGMAMGERFLRERFGTDLVDHRTFVLASDGDLMEGISYEAASLAGHLGLGRLVVLYDDNEISIDGSTDLSFTEDRQARFAAQGWHVQTVDGHDPEAIANAIQTALDETGRPSLISCRTIIGKDSPKAGSESSHGAPLGPDNVAATKRALGLDPEATFYVDPKAVEGFRAHDGAEQHKAWQARLAEHARGPELKQWLAGEIDSFPLPSFEEGKGLATRKASAATLKELVKVAPWLLGGSADLAGSNGVNVGLPALSRESFPSPATVHFGVREHAMASIANGLCLHGGVRPYVATFLVFHDYMRPAVRLSCLMKQPVLYVYTHDSVFLGEDGPTHQPIETLLALRALPGLHVYRPADAHEAAHAWKAALSRTDGPSALILTRQGLPIRAELPHGAMADGAYVIRKEKDQAKVVLVATGSEVSLCLDAAELLAQQDIDARVVSMPCVERFLDLDPAERDAILPPGVPRVSVEAGRTYGWERIVGDTGRSYGIDDFGLSAPYKEIAEELGFTPANIAYVARSVLS